ncbi:MAG: TetR family transcriptional regulator [Streptosporangiales bacterium]|nr:TetR family transcriptional regulator [Streptosporangiales bacterium]
MPGSDSVGRPWRGRKAEQGETTRAALVRAATEIFAEKGFVEAATEEVVRRADVTRGALYHHFSGKDDLFRAVFESLEEDIADRVAAAAAGVDDPVGRLRAGTEAFLDACLEPAVQRVMLREGPSALGWDRWHRVQDDRCARTLLRIGLEDAMAVGALRRQPAEPLTHLVYGALVQAGMVIAGVPDARAARAARREMGQAAGRLIDALLADRRGDET